MAARWRARMRVRPDASAPAPAYRRGERQWRRLPSAPSEQPDRPPHQQRDHDEIDEERAEAGHVILPCDIADADYARGSERSADRAEPADRHHDKHIDQIGEREGWIEPDDLDRQRAAKPRKA